MINKTSIFLLLSLLFFGCERDIEDYFHKDTEATVATDILTLLKENENYSQFVDLLEEYQVDTLLSKGNVYTFFVPNNSAMDNYVLGTLGNKEIVEYLMTESYVNLNQINKQTKIQTFGSKFAFIDVLGDSSFTFDGTLVLKGSPLTTNGRYYEIEELVQPKPNLYEYISATNEFYRNYLDAQDSTYLDKTLSTPVGYTDNGLTVYDTVLTTVNLFDLLYYPLKDEFRDRKATMLLFTQEQYDQAIEVVANELNISRQDIPDVWQNEVLMPDVIRQSVFRGAISHNSFLKGRAKNILGDSIDVYPDNIIPDVFECSNGLVYSFVDFQIPVELYKRFDTIPLSSLLFKKGNNDLWGWREEVIVTGQTFDPKSNANSSSTFGNTLLIDMGKNFNGDFSLAYTHKNLFPAKYKLTLRASVSKTGIYNIFVNGKQYPVDIRDGNGPKYDFDFFNLRNGVVSSVTNKFYPFKDNFCSFDILVDNITEFGDVEVKLVYVSSSSRNKNNCGLNIDFISLDYFNNNN